MSGGGDMWSFFWEGNCSKPPSRSTKYLLPWKPPTFSRYNPYFDGLKPSFFHGFSGSKGGWISETWSPHSSSSCDPETAGTTGAHGAGGTAVLLAKKEMGNQDSKRIVGLKLLLFLSPKSSYIGSLLLNFLWLGNQLLGSFSSAWMENW